MDHLPSFGASSPIHVPYVCTEIYDGGDFFDYPQRKGWDKEKLYNGDFEGRKPEETASFLQAWMYFGLLHHIFQPVSPSFSSTDFIRQLQSGEKEITTEKLPAYVIGWYQRESDSPAEQRQARLNSINKCFRELHPFVMRYCGANSLQYRQPPTYWPLSQEISLSIIVLADSLNKASQVIIGARVDYNWGISALLVNRMKEAGWCNNSISTLKAAKQVHMLYYASTLGPPMARKDHVSCNDYTCKADQIDEQEYPVKHRPDCSGCEFIGPSLEDVIKAMESGKIPLISYREVNGQMTVDVLDYSSTASLPEYIALSHVWADGLGNPKKNSLPMCQMKYVQHLVDSLRQDKTNDRPSIWWCDTICVPVEAKHKIYRDKAIRAMRDIYQKANKVLALDSGLVHLSEASSTIEVYMRIKLSGWMRRLWTLQEGTLARDVYFQLSDCTLKLRDLDSRMMKEAAVSGQFLYTQYSVDCFLYFAPFLRGQVRSRSEHLLGIWRQLQWRSTSHQYDETLCLATLLGIDPAPLLAIPQEDLEQRMVKFLQICGTLPRSILFQMPPRLNSPGFRWAPKSFLACFKGSASHPDWFPDSAVEIAPAGRGIIAALAGLEILVENSPSPLIGNDFVIHPLPETTPPLAYRLSYIGPKDTGQPDRKATNVDGSRQLKNPIVLLGQALSAVSQVNAVLVDLCDVQSDSEYREVNFIAWVGLQAQKGPYYPMARGDQIASDDFWANQLPESQKWLIN